MKIILTKNIPKLGQPGDIKNVADGYALNYLLPNKLARAATDEVIRDIENKKQKTRQKKSNQSALHQDSLSKIKNKKIIIKAKTSDKGHLFASVSPKQIAQELEAQLKVAISEKDIKIDKPLKEIGEYTLLYCPANNISAQFFIIVKSSG